VIGCAFKVGNALGRGYLEKVYENALVHEMRKLGLRVDQQRRLHVWYDGVIVGEHAADVVIEDLVLVEPKAARAIDPSCEAQCLNYLATTKFPICLLLIFWTRVEVRRIVGPEAPIFPHTGITKRPVEMAWAEMAEFGDETGNR
jgi:GxxExxY protein